MGENGMYRILVCDDERDIVSALRIYLTAEGYEVLEAYNGSEMLRLAAMQEVHLILLDVMMPGMDGLSAMAELRRTSNVPRLRFRFYDLHPGQHSPSVRLFLPRFLHSSARRFPPLFCLFAHLQHPSPPSVRSCHSTDKRPVLNL